MKLKRLEIHGFKSFPEKATIQFPPGISAVVGPNGCGKSNVVDALRWVMGEQSVKQLRGKNMEDVIFSGSNGKQPLNMAEVSLILENDNGSAPEEFKDFTEIMLARRFFRSGESAYYINKQPCRLKDIHNIFLGSGLSTKSYAVIQQGNIGAIIDAGPDERRFFIEEAAGVTRFKRRKEEALRKVASTNQNLLRITDILAEIKRQMASLKRQARKAELYKKYQEQIRKFDVLLGLINYDDYKCKIDETDTLLRNLKDTDFGHTSELNKIDAAVEMIKLKRLQKNQEISNQRSKIFETQRSLDKNENNLVHNKADIERLANEARDLESAHADLKGKIREIVAEINQVEGQDAGLKVEETNVKSTIDLERSGLQKISDQLSLLNQELETIKSNFLNLVTREARYKNTYQNISSNRENLRRRLTRTDEEAIEAERKVSELQIAETKAKEDLESFKKTIDDLDKRISVTQDQLAKKSNALSEQIKLVQTLDLERNKAKSKHVTLKKMEDNFEWYKEGVRTIMKKDRLKEGKLDAEFEKIKKNGIINIMADIIEPKPSFEIAVEAALGDTLQHILVKDQEVGIGLVDYLQTHHAGRSGFIPVAALNPIDRNHQRKPDPAKLLLNQITVKPGFEKVTEALLGHVVVSSDIKEALALFNSNGTLQTIVTKNGDLISHQGVIIGGSNENDSGILGKKQELKRLKKQIADFNQKLESARQDQKSIESKVRELESGLQKQIEQRNESSYDKTEAEKILYRVTEDLKHAKRHLEITFLEQEQLRGEESDISEEIIKYDKAIAEITDEVKAAQDKVSITSEKIDSLTSEMETYNQNIIDLKMKLTSLNAKSENNNNTLKRLKEFRDDGISRIEKLSNTIAQKKQQREVSKQKITEYEHMLSVMYDDMKQFELELAGKEEDFHVIDSELKENDSTISEIQSKRDETLQKIRLLEIEQSERHIKQENIVNRLVEQYRRSFAELRSQFREMLDGMENTTTEMEDELSKLRIRIDRIHDVNLGAIKEYEQFNTRFDFLSEQQDDLLNAIDNLHKVIKKINRITQEHFLETLNLVNKKLDEVFPNLFEGGSAQLVLTEPNRPLETGVEFMIHPPGKKLTRMSLLSGGEKALSAIAFVFSIFLIKPASFCLMDEIDAPLDEANIYRFNNLLQIIGEKSQIIMITHNKKTMEFADTLFGITMEEKGISKIVSVNFQ